MPWGRGVSLTIRESDGGTARYTQLGRAVAETQPDLAQQLINDLMNQKAKLPRYQRHDLTKYEDRMDMPLGFPTVINSELSLVAEMNLNLQQKITELPKDVGVFAVLYTDPELLGSARIGAVELDANGMQRKVRIT